MDNLRRGSPPGCWTLIVTTSSESFILNSPEQHRWFHSPCRPHIEYWTERERFRFRGTRSSSGFGFTFSASKTNGAIGLCRFYHRPPYLPKDCTGALPSLPLSPFPPYLPQTECRPRKQCIRGLSARHSTLQYEYYLLSMKHGEKFWKSQC